VVNMRDDNLSERKKIARKRGAWNKGAKNLAPPNQYLQDKTDRRRWRNLEREAERLKPLFGSRIIDRALERVREERA